MDFGSTKFDFALGDKPSAQLQMVPGQNSTAIAETENAVAKKASRRRQVAEKKSWEMSMAPGKAVFMNLFMLWMGGSSPGIFSVLIMGYVVSSTIGSITKVHQAFEPFRQLGIDCSLQSLAYVAINLATFAYITYSASSSGMLPTASGDWLALIPSQRVVEVSRGSLI